MFFFCCTLSRVEGEGEESLKFSEGKELACLMFVDGKNKFEWKM